jgi:hypothetical protein
MSEQQARYGLTTRTALWGCDRSPEVKPAAGPRRNAGKADLAISLTLLNPGIDNPSEGDSKRSGSPGPPRTTNPASRDLVLGVHLAMPTFLW